VRIPFTFTATATSVATAIDPTEQEYFHVTNVRHPRLFGAAVGVGLLGLIGLLTGAGSVFAHAQYNSSTPYSGATLASAPAKVQVSWTQELASVQFTITRPDGTDVTTGPGKIDVNKRKNASVPIRDGGPGQYTVVWHNVSADDGDPNDGSFVFSVAAPARTAAAAPAPQPASAAAAQPVASAPSCIDNGVVAPGIADVRVNTYCKRQAIRDQYRGKIREVVFNFDLSIGMGLESSLADATATPTPSR
jgi:methionine-rich copper-binding protein CopC